MSMPDTWEYPWFAAWDLAFHCVALVHVDPAFAKYQLRLLCREWFQHPNGALPAYEWDFNDVNPPVQAWAALEVFAIDGGRDFDFLSRIFDKLLVNFTWWVNREDADGSNLFEGGFMGLDNIGPIDRSHLPDRRAPRAVRRHRLDGQLRAVDGDDRDDPARCRATGPRSTWCRSSSSTSRASRKPLRPLGFGTRRTASSTTASCCPTAVRCPLRVRSIAAVIPLLAVAVVDDEASTAPCDRQVFATICDAMGRGTAEMADAGGSCAGSRVSGSCWSASPVWTGCAGCARSCSTRRSSCRRTGCARCRPTTATIRTSWRCRVCAQASTTSPPSRPPRCSAATRIGVGRCGFR